MISETSSDREFASGGFGKLEVNKDTISFFGQDPNNSWSISGGYKYICPMTWTMNPRDDGFNVNVRGSKALLVVSIESSLGETKSFYFEAKPGTASQIFELVAEHFSHSNSSCFVATQVYNDSNSDEVVALRKWRDEVLLQNAFGKVFVKYYYRFGEKMALFLKNHTLIEKTVKWAIDLLVSHIKRKSY